jgi:hypothetical protein
MLLGKKLCRLECSFIEMDRFMASCILDVKYEHGVFHVISTEFGRLDVPMGQIPQLQRASVSQISNYEVDTDGSYVFWPELDLHMGWKQFQQIADPQAAQKALQNLDHFNVRYGKAIQKVREMHGIKKTDVTGLSSKQLSGIEAGKCRLTANGIKSLACAHNLEANAYLQLLANALGKS